MTIGIFSISRDISLRFLNTTMRAVTLSGRFILFFFLARFLEPDEIGYYGLFSATLLFCILIVGLDFYTFSQREILSTSTDEHSKIILRQAFFHLITYVFLLPILGFIFVFDFLPKRFVLWFYLLLPLEHIAQELSRVLIAMGQPLLSGFILFLKTGFWTLFGIIGILYFPNLRSLDLIFALWGTGCVLAIFFALSAINKQILIWKIPKWSNEWMLRGAKTGMIFLVSSLSFRALTTFDRHIVKSISGADTLGVYVFFTSISASLMTFMDSGVFVFLFPKIVESYRKQKWGDFLTAIKRLTRDTFFVTTVLILAAVILVPCITGLLGKNVYIEKLPIFWLLLAATSIRSLSMIPHYALYAFGKDREILFSQFTGIIIFLAGCLVIPKTFNGLIVPISLSLSFTYILITKLFFSVFYWKQLQSKKYE